MVVRGISVTSVSRTIADCAQVLEVDQLIVLMREARHLGTLDLEELASYCRPRRKGAGRLRQALERFRTHHRGFRSQLERDVRDIVVARGLPDPAINRAYAIHDPTIEEDQIEIDQSWADRMLALEVDGPTHDDPVQREIDERRRSALRRAGWDVHEVHWRAFRDDPRAATDSIVAAWARATSSARR